MSMVFRILIGATGGLAAVLAKFIAQDQSFVSHWANMHDPRFYDIILGYAILTPILIFLGGVVTAFADETNKLKLLAMGVAAPAMITTMAGGPGSLSPSVPYTVGPAGWVIPFSPSIAVAAEFEPTKLAQSSAIQKGVDAFFGSGKGEQHYWVIVGSFTDKSQAEALASRINKQDQTAKAFVGKRMPDNEYYPVIVGNYVSLSDARKLRDQASRLSGINNPPYLSAFPDRIP